MPLDVRGILENVSLGIEQVVEISPYLREVFINEAPFISRTERVPAPGTTFQIDTYDVRPRTYTLGAALTVGATTITLNDTTPLLVGDVLEVIDGAGATLEHVEVTDIPSATTATIRRAREGTVAVANDNATSTVASRTVTLIGNSRTGAEIDQVANRAVRTIVTQYCQTFQYPVQVGGLANAAPNTRIPAGFSNVFSMEQQVKMSEMMRDVEYTMYYGLGEAAATPGDRPKMKGLKKMISAYNAGANIRTNAGANYTKFNFIADTIQKTVDAGGNPDVFLVSTDFITGLATWTGGGTNFIQPRANAFGTTIDEFYASFTGKPVQFIPSYQLKKGSVFALTSDDIRVGYIREEFMQLRGNRGDARECDLIGDLTVSLAHPGWHSVVEGITSWA